MRLGMPVLLECPDLAACGVLCRELGLDFVELNGNLPACQPDTLKERTLRRIQEEQGIFFTLHLDEDADPCHFNPLVAEAWTRTVLAGLELAQRMEMPVVNMHLPSGVFFTLPEARVYLYERYRDRYLRDLRRFRDRCREAVGDSGVRICMENTGGYTPSQREGLEVLLECPAFGLTLDTGHDFCMGGVDGAWIRERGSRLYHIHLHDAEGKRNHLPLGQGELDLDACWELASAGDRTVVLEVKTIAGLRTSAAWCHSRRKSAGR